jgi:hypothetical protein
MSLPYSRSKNEPIKKTTRKQGANKAKGLHDIVFQKIELFITTAVRTSNFTQSFNSYRDTHEITRLEVLCPSIRLHLVVKEKHDRNEWRSPVTETVGFHTDMTTSSIGIALRVRAGLPRKQGSMIRVFSLVHPASYPLITDDSFPGVKAPGTRRWLFTCV